MSEQSTSIGKLAEALAKAQGEMRNAKKDAQNPHFKNTYATLAAVLDAVREPLSRNGLAIVQTTEPHGDTGVCVVTTLLHASGEWVRGKLFLPATKKDAQGFGAAMSYARRYALASIVGIAQEDDDGEAAVARSSLKAVPAAPPSEPSDHGAEDGFRTMLAGASTPDALAKASTSVAAAVKAGQLSKAARERLRKDHEAASRRLTEAS